MSMRFHGKKLQKVEQDGWIFASNGKAYAAVKFLDGGYEWDESGELASPLSGSGIATTTRVLMQTGDMDSYASFKAFQSAVLANPLRVQRDQVAYQSSRDGSQVSLLPLRCTRAQAFQTPNDRWSGNRLTSRLDLQQPLPQQLVRRRSGEGKHRSDSGSLRLWNNEPITATL